MYVPCTLGTYGNLEVVLDTREGETHLKVLWFVSHRDHRSHPAGLSAPVLKAYIVF